MSKKSRNKNAFPRNVEENIMEMTKFTKIIAASVGTQQIEKFASTDERKAIWVLCSGKLTRDQIVQQSGISLRTVTTFIDMLKTHGLIEEETGKGGHPKRVIDHVLSEWKTLVEKKKKPTEEEKLSEEPKPPTEQNLQPTV